MTAPNGEREFIARMQLSGEPLANMAAQVRVGNARFTVLTSRLLRLEWSPGASFEDRGSYSFPNRRAEVPRFTVDDDGGTTVIDTGDLVLRYQPDGQPFHAGNMRIDVNGNGGYWTPGLRDKHNLGGGRRTVDMCRGDARLENGLVSRSGWSLFDDSTTILFDTDGWVCARDEVHDSKDWYFFGYGHDYAAAVSDYTQFGGSIPLVPRWILGAWWSRYWPYRDSDLRDLVDEFGEHDLPLDVLVIDMDWHLPNSWTGYTWNRELFPDPRGFLDWLHLRGLHTTLNLHPALGVQSFEDVYPQFAQAMGVDITGGAAVPFHVGDPRYMRHYFEMLHHPIEDEGIDFWWMDWQQGRSSEVAGIDPLPWLNHLHFQDMSRRPERRPISFSRWGGLGSHRYPIGFSGDAFAEWSALRFQPRYTAAGANVGYGWWSHDIGGHVGPDDPELYVRWVQFGALSPVLRLHSNQNPTSERRPWMFGADALVAARAAFHQRYELVPYLYTAARIAADTGVSPVRPMAWTAPEDDSAYAARYQYLLGDALLVAPVVHPAEPSTGLADVDVWLPAGDWVERSTGEHITGPRWVRQLADLFRVPQFVRTGTVLPLAEVAATTGAQPQDHLVLSVFPGAGGTTRVYEDDGTSSAFAAGSYSWTTVTTESPDPSRFRLTIEPNAADGARRYTVRVEATQRPLEVTLDGDAHSWQYDPATATTLIEISPRLRDRLTTVVVTADGLLATGDAHDAAVRARDVRRLLGDETLGDDLLNAAVRALPDDHPSRASAIARIGGPLVRVFEYTAPDEAAALLGRVIVAAAPAEAVRLEASWTLERGGTVVTRDVEPTDVAPGGTILDAPFGWDDSRTPTRWSVAVTATWGDVVVRENHHSAVLMPSITSWRVVVIDAAQTPSLAEVLTDLSSQRPLLDWRLMQSDPFDIDFPELTQRYDVPLHRDPAYLSGTAYIVHAATELTVGQDCDVAFSYFSSDVLEVFVDGSPVRPDVTGRPPTSSYTPHPQLRRTAALHLTSGKHVLLFRCLKAAELPWSEWCLSAGVVGPDGSEALGVMSDATPRH